MNHVLQSVVDLAFFVDGDRMLAREIGDRMDRRVARIQDWPSATEAARQCSFAEFRFGINDALCMRARPSRLSMGSLCTYPRSERYRRQGGPKNVGIFALNNPRKIGENMIAGTPTGQGSGSVVSGALEGSGSEPTGAVDGQHDRLLPRLRGRAEGHPDA